MQNEMTLLCYATPNFYSVRDQLILSAMRFGLSRFFVYTDQMLKGTIFYEKNKAILEQPRGAGYWLWKPYLISEALKRLNEGDILLYLDAGIELIETPREWIEISLANQDVALFTGSPKDEYTLNRRWTKRDVFIYLDADTEKFWDASQVQGGYVALRKSDDSIRFIEKWLDTCQQSGLITDAPNRLGKPNLPEFIDHRHDQAILSVLAMKENIPFHRLPSQEGTKGIPFFPNDTYGQIAYHHRGNQNKKFLKTHKYTLKDVSAKVFHHLKNIAKEFREVLRAIVRLPKAIYNTFFMVYLKRCRKKSL